MKNKTKTINNLERIVRFQNKSIHKMYVKYTKEIAKRNYETKKLNKLRNKHLNLVSKYKDSQNRANSLQKEFNKSNTTIDVIIFVIEAG